MLIEHRGASPTVDPSAYVAPNAVLCGEVHVGAGARILFGAVLSAEDGRVDVGERTVVMENALVRGRRRTPASPIFRACGRVARFDCEAGCGVRGFLDARG